MKSFAEQQPFKNSVLCLTSRRFYVRKKPSHQLFNNQNRIEKVIKTLNMSHTMRKMKRIQFIKTQADQIKHNQQRYNNDFNETQFIKKQLKSAIQINIKKLNKKWKHLLESYQDIKSCTKQQTISAQQNLFYRSFLDLIKQNVHKSPSKLTYQKNNIKKNHSSNNQFQNAKINVENIRLSKENDILRQKIGQLPSNRNQSQFQTVQHFSQINTILSSKMLKKQSEVESIQKFKEQIRNLRQSVFELQNQNIKLKQSAVSTEDALNNLKQQKSQLSKKVAELKNQNQTVCSQLVEFRLDQQNTQCKVDRWRATVMFQRQQIISLETQLSSIKNQYKDLMRKYKLLLKRFNNLQNNNFNGNSPIRQVEQLNPKYYEIFKEQLQSFNKIKTLFLTKQGQNSLDKSSSGLQKKTKAVNHSNYKNFISQKQSLNNPNGIKRLSRQHYSYFKPTFYNFVQNYMDIHGIDQNTITQCSNTYDINIDFFITMRAILDSKFNQFLIEDFKSVSSLCNFTYVWLSKYKIHTKKKKIIQIKGDIDGQIIPSFYINLMSQKLNSNWQVITFRQFLMQSLTLDQLYFYLMARHYVFQGDFLTNINAIYQQVYYISIADALNLLHKFITDINYRKKVEEFIKRFIIYIRKRALVDAHFILRILLEFYQSKKHQQFINLNSLAELLSKEKSPSFSFQSFLKIFQYNFTYLSLTQKVQIYKKCFSCSKGKINLQTILTVLTQNGYLCGQIKKIFLNDSLNYTQKSQNKQIQSNEEQDNKQKYFPNVQKFDKFFTKFIKQSFELQRQNIGLQNIQSNFKNVLNFDETNIFKRIQMVFQFSIIILRKRFYSRSNYLFIIILEINSQTFVKNLHDLTQILQNLTNITCEKKQIMDLMQQFKRNSAAKKILRFYRKKRNQMHRTFIFGLKDQILQQDQKIQGIRKQFNCMIQNLKQKFQPSPINQQQPNYQD